MNDHDSSQWYRQAFDEYYADLYSHRDSAEAESFVLLLQKHVALGSALVLDLACGGGRHMAALENAGARAVGLDLSSALLRKASTAGRGALVRGDMRVLPFADAAVDGVVSMFTSFGYFPDLENEMAVLREVGRCLKPDGWFVIDYMNSNLVRKTLKPESQRRVGHLVVHERRSVDEAGGRVVKEIQLTDRGHLVKGYTEKVKLLEADELSSMLTDAGLEPKLFWGDYFGEGYNENESPRLIVFCGKSQ